MTVSIEERDRLIGLHLNSEEGCRRLAISMVKPLATRIGWYCPLSWVYNLADDSSGVSERVLSSEMHHHLPLSEVLQARHRSDLFTQMVNTVRFEMSKALVTPLFKHLHAQASAGDLTVDSLQRFSARLAVEGEGLVHRPALLMNAHTFADIRKNTNFHKDYCDEECQRTTLLFGSRAAIDGCKIYVSKNIDPGQVFVVSKRPNQLRGPISVSVNLTEFPSKSREQDGRTAGHLGFQFKAAIPISGGWPDVVRLRA